MFAPTNDPNNTRDQVITSNAFFPDITVAEFQDEARLQDTVTDKRVVKIITDAIINVNTALNTWKEDQEALGNATLADVVAPTINDISTKVHQYRTAVYARAKASILEKYSDVDTTRAGSDRADELYSARDDYLQEAHEAIAAITGRSRAVVELI